MDWCKQISLNKRAGAHRKKVQITFFKFSFPINLLSGKTGDTILTFKTDSRGEEKGGPLQFIFHRDYSKHSLINCFCQNDNTIFYIYTDKKEKLRFATCILVPSLFIITTFILLHLQACTTRVSSRSVFTIQRENVCIKTVFLTGIYSLRTNQT